VVKLSKKEWERFTDVYGEEMYRDKLRCSVIASKDNAAYVEITFGQGMDHTGYDLVKDFQQKLVQQGELFDV
jgi:hypothetical protein